MTLPSVLIVDDERHVNHVVRYKLEQSGLHVWEARNGKEGFDLALKELPDLIVTDFQMPVLSGFEMAKELLAQDETKHIPIILLTARAHKLPPSELAKTNIQLVIPKPFSPRSLVNEVHGMLPCKPEEESCEKAA